MNIQKRVLISVDDFCPFQCKHCYTYQIERDVKRTIDQIVASIANEKFDIVYISQRSDSFADPAVGLELCEKVFQRYKCNILIITRNILDNNQYQRLLELNKIMTAQNKMLFWACSVIGMESANVSENTHLIPKTTERIKFLSKLKTSNIRTMLLIRPLFPSFIIPNSEIEKIVELAANSAHCIITGPLMVNDKILMRLNIGEKTLKYCNGDTEYLQGALAESMKYVDVSDEIAHLDKICNKLKVPLFKHSMPAINFLLGNT